MGISSGERLRREQVETLVLEMALGAQKPAQIRKALKAQGVAISEKRILAIIDREMKAERDRRRKLGVGVFDMKLNQLDAIIRSNWTILVTPCVRCSGRGHIGQDPDRQQGVMLTCERCKGDTKQFDARDRATASKEVRQAIAEQCKLLGLYAPEKFAFTDDDERDVDFRDELVEMDIEDLNKEWASVQAAMEADKEARRLSIQREEAASGG